MSGETRIPVAVLGATGIVGQHLVRMLDGHPWFRLAEVVASRARAGSTYGNAVEWVIGPEPPREARGLVLSSVDRTPASPVVLSALPGRVARDVEVRLANEGRLVSSNASVHRMRPDVPLMVPEVNPGALSLAEAQPWRRSGGVLVCNPNCVATGVSLALAPLHRRWGIGEVVMVTLQALSGAGLGGPSALSMTGNVIPWIEGEEEKIPGELGRLLGGAFPVAVAANRVPVADGHTAHVFLRFDRRAGAAEVAAELRRSGRGEAAVSLPTLPDRSLVVVDGADRPQPLLDAGRSGGMKVSVGRVRSAPPSDVAMVVVSHNAVRGAAGACLANAELCVARGLGPEGASAAL